MAWLVNPSTTRSMTSSSAGVRRSKRVRRSSQRLLARELVEDASEASVDGGQQMRIVDRLLDEVLRAGLDGGDRHRHVGMAGDQDDGQRKAAARKLAHELDAVHARHAHVGHDAARAASRRLPEEGVGRVVGFHVVAEHAQHLAQRLAHRLLVVDDEDRGAWSCSGDVLALNRQRQAELRGARHRSTAARCARRAPARSTRRSKGQGRARPSWRRIAARTAAGRREMPPPLSQTPISTAGSRSDRWALMRMRPSERPVSTMASTALRTRLSTTCWSWMRSPKIEGRPSPMSRSIEILLAAASGPGENEGIVQHRAHLEGAEMRAGRGAGTRACGGQRAGVVDLRDHAREVGVRALPVGVRRAQHLLHRARQRASRRHRLIDLVGERRGHAAHQVDARGPCLPAPASP